MKISYNWLKQFLNIDWNAQKTAALLTDLGLEVEGIDTFESVKGGLQGVVVGHVITCDKHPNADRLKLTTVDIGTDEPVQIVCGAPNVAAGQKVPVATVGTTLYPTNGERLTIKKGKIRGEVSFGMICAEDELGLGANHDGIMVLDKGLKPGTPCAEVFKIEKDEVFEIGLTPNRADAMSHFGVARDLRAGLIQQEIQKELITPPVSQFHIEIRSFKLDVEVQAPELAPRYCGVTISNLEVGPSPIWLQNRLKAIGLTPKNNVVDATNYVMHELGQPLHAFDANRIHGKKVIVKTVESGTKFMTLDGEERELHADDLMICDAEKPMCIAGVFGGINTGVTEDTKAIFLESAYFDPISIRKTAKRHGLNTDASFRFERGIDIEQVEYSLKRAALLITEIAGGAVTSDIMDLYPKKPKEQEVFLHFDKIYRLIGQEINRDQIKSILTSLEIKVKNVTETGMGLTVPSYRVDVTRQEDVIEEILRVYGYNKIGIGTKINASVAPSSRYEDHRLQNITGNLLAAQGFYEIMTNSLGNPDHTRLLNGEADDSVALLNPLSNELSALRTTLLFNGLETISYNLNRKSPHLNLFEFGKSYHRKENENQQEKSHLALFMTGGRNADDWVFPEKKTDFFYIKSIIHNLLLRLGIGTYDEMPVNGHLFSEGLSFHGKKGQLAQFGPVRKKILKHFDIGQEVLFADVDWNVVQETLKTTGIKKVLDVPKYPSVKRDFALLLDASVPFKKIKDLALATERKLLTNVQLFDVYTGKNLPKGKKSYAVSYTLQDPNKTLTDKQVDKVMQKLQKTYEKELGATLR